MNLKRMTTLQLKKSMNCCFFAQGAACCLEGSIADKTSKAGKAFEAAQVRLDRLEKEFLSRRNHKKYLDYNYL